MHPRPQALIVNLQTELDISCALSAGYSPEVCSQTCSGSIENRRVGEVQELSPELNPSLFVDGKFLVNAQVERRQSWPANSTDTAGAKCSRSSGPKDC